MDKKKIFTWKNSIIAFGFLIAALYPPLSGNSYIIHIGLLFFIWSVVASSWNLLNGYCGIISLGNVSFLVLGSYISAILVKQFAISPWLAILLAGVGTSLLVTVLLGFPALRLKGIYIALMTLIFSDTLSPILTQSREITGGRMGLHAVPPFFPGMEKVHAYFLCLLLFLVAHFVIYRVIHSSTGLAFITLRDSEAFAMSIGVNFFNERLKVFAISSFITGIAGGFYIHSLGDISPTTLGIEPFLMGIAMMEFGGIGTFLGPVLGAFVIVFGGEFLRLADTLRLSLVGALICLTILFFPGGAMQLVENLSRIVKNRIAGQRSKKVINNIAP